MSRDNRERKEPPNVDGMFTLKVDNLSFGTTVEMLREAFSGCGEIGDIYIPRKFNSTENRGFAFVRFLERTSGEEALEKMQGREVDGREITIAEARERRPANPREAMRERGGGRDRDFDRDYRSGGGGYRDRDRYDDRDSRDRGYSRRDDDRDRGRDRDRDRSRDRGYSRRDDRDRGNDRDRDRVDRDRDSREDRDRLERRRSRS